MSVQIALTAETMRILELASSLARERHQHMVDTEHLLVGALQNDRDARQAIEAAGGVPDSIIDSMLNELGMVRDEPLDNTQGLTTRAKQRIAQAATEARQLGQEGTHPAHLVLAILAQPGPVLQEILDKASPLNLSSLRDYIRANIQSGQAQRADVETLAGSAKPARQPKRVGKAPTITIRNEAAKRDRDNLIFVALAALLIAGIGLVMNPEVAIPVIIVVGGWIFSLTLHEFAHSLVAYWGGDKTVVEKGYLSFNPLKYTHPLLSIGLPVLFLAMGGIGLPGGAVYINTGLLRNKYWRTAVALAGPLANLICLALFSAPFWTGYVSFEMIIEDFNFWSSLAFLCFLQSTAIFFNLIPFPPFDGFNAISPYLPRDLVNQLYSLGFIGLFLIIFLINVPWFSDAFFTQVFQLTDYFQIDPQLAIEGLDVFTFWN